MRDHYTERDLAVLKEVRDYLEQKPVPIKSRVLWDGEKFITTRKVNKNVKKRILP